MDLSDLSALLGEDVTAANNTDVWVVLPAPVGSAARPADLALVGEARRLADGLGCYVHAVVGSEAAAQAAIACGADRAHVTADPAAYLASQQPEFVLFASVENALAGALAQRLKAGLITNTVGPLAIDGDTRALLGSHAVYGGEYFLDLAVTSPVKMATLDTSGLNPPSSDPDRSGEVLLSDLPLAEPRWRDLGPASYQPPQWRPLTKAHTIVSVGRGLRDEEGFVLAQQLAHVLGAELAGDRSAHECAWVDEAHEVGVTGQEVAPDLYIALGIAGDTIHNAAITGARRVLAIHSNPAAPIFKAADLGLVGEPKDVLAQIIAALK